MIPSNDLIEFLRNWEGPPSLKVREDPAAPGVYDIGYGHVCKPDHEPVTLEQCEDMLTNDVHCFAADVDDLVKVSLAQHEFDAVVSFAFNVGLGALEKSTLLKRINDVDFDGAAEEFARWNRAGGKVVRGLVKRRAAELSIFCDGDYSKRP